MSSKKVQPMHNWQKYKLRKLYEKMKNERWSLLNFLLTQRARNFVGFIFDLISSLFCQCFSVLAPVSWDTTTGLGDLIGFSIVVVHGMITNVMLLPGVTRDCHFKESLLTKNYSIRSPLSDFEGTANSGTKNFEL